MADSSHPASVIIFELGHKVCMQCTTGHPFRSAILVAGELGSWRQCAGEGRAASVYKCDRRRPTQRVEGHAIHAAIGVDETRRTSSIVIIDGDSRIVERF